MTADPAGVDRLGQCSRSADLNDSVNPLPGDSCCGSTPFRFALVVDQVVRAEILQTRQFFIGRRGGDDRRAGGLGESDLQGKVAAWAKLHPVGRWVKASADMTTYSAARPSAPSPGTPMSRSQGKHSKMHASKIPAGLSLWRPRPASRRLASPIVGVLRVLDGVDFDPTAAAARTEPASRYRGRRCCWPIARILRSVRWGNELGFTIKRFSAAWSGRWAMGRWRRSRIGHGRVKNPSSRRRPKPGWCRWRATRPRSTAIRMSCGRRGFWHVTHASTARRRGTNVSPGWFKARCARSSARRKSSRTRCATI